MSTAALYDAFSADYDQFVDWDQRLAYEMPFVLALLESVGAERILDLACGTGRHAIALAQAGYEVTAADLSGAMVERARANAVEAGVRLGVVLAGFGELARTLGKDSSLDAVVCLGNSLPHVLTRDGLDDVLVDIATVLRPGGLLLIQQRNFDMVLDQEQRYMPPQRARVGNREWLFMRFYDDEADGNLAFNVVRMSRQVGDAWNCELGRAMLHPWRAAELGDACVRAGFRFQAYGSLAGDPFDDAASSDLVMSAVRD